MKECDPVSDPNNWNEVAGEDGYLILCGADKKPREILTSTDEYFVKAVVRHTFPGWSIKIVTDSATGRKYLLRKRSARA